jgi:chromosome segregation ATPase
LIKHGQSTATIEITLNNKEKASAYKYDVYGPKIIVIRTLRTSGSAYKICNHRGRFYAVSHMHHAP